MKAEEREIIIVALRQADGEEYIKSLSKIACSIKVPDSFLAKIKNIIFQVLKKWNYF